MTGTLDPDESVLGIPQPNGAPPTRITYISSFIKT
jgi:hypothetical protein